MATGLVLAIAVGAMAQNSGALIAFFTGEDMSPGQDDQYTINPPKAYPEQWDTEGLQEEIKTIFALDLPVADWAAEEGVDDEVVTDRLCAEVDKAMAQKVVKYGVDTMRQVEKQVLLQSIDKGWREHLLTMEHLRSVVGLRGYAQRDPLNEYKTEAFTLFEHLLDDLRNTVTNQLAHVQIMSQEEQQAMIAQMQAAAAAQQQAATGDTPPAQPSGNAPQPATASPSLLDRGINPDDPETWTNLGRNESCPCGSGKKYKHCHGKV